MIFSIKIHSIHHQCSNKIYALFIFYFFGTYELLVILSKTLPNMPWPVLIVVFKTNKAVTIAIILDLLGIKLTSNKE